MDVVQEWLTRSHMPQILAIENMSFEYPWCEENFLHHLRQRNVIGYVVRDLKQVVGFTLYQANKDSLDILNLVVHPKRRRQGFGRMLVDMLIAKLPQQNRNAIRVNCWERNLPAQLFFRALGFRATGIDRSGYHQIGRQDDDSYVMEYLLNECGGTENGNL